MDNRGRQTISEMAGVLKNYDQPTPTRPVREKPEHVRLGDVKPLELKFDVNKSNQPVRKTAANAMQDTVVSHDRLQEAIIWSEILGEPLCKRRKRR